MSRPSSARKGLAALGAMAMTLAADEPSFTREAENDKGGMIALPAVSRSAVPLDEVIGRRRSVRTFSTEPLSLEQIGQLCWAAQGITEPASGYRAAPSAGALYPLQLYVVLPQGVFQYEPRGHRMRRVDPVDRRAALSSAALDQDAVHRAGLDLVITGSAERTRAKYHDRAERYLNLEAGHAAQNVLLEATALGLASVPIGAFDDSAVRRTIGVPAGETPLYIVAVGRPAA